MRFRKSLKISSKTSTVTNAFVQAIIPSDEPSAAMRDKTLEVLGMNRGTMTCVYCGGVTSDWDHLRPLVRDGDPTGYFNEVRNLVPACGRCNQSKSGQEWRSWMTGTAKNSPASSNISGIDARIESLNRFVAWGDHAPIHLAKLADLQLWDDYWNQLKNIKQMMHNAQQTADQLRRNIANALAAHDNVIVAPPPF